MQDLKKLTFELYQHQVLIFFKMDSEEYKKYGSEISGKLVSRNWGIRETWKTSYEPEQTVVGISIEIENASVIEVSCAAIQYISRIY